MDILTSLPMSKVLVSFDDRLLARIDRVARSRGLSRSAYLAELAARDAGAVEGPGRSAVVRAALGDLDRILEPTPAEDSTAAIRGARDAR